MLNPTPHTELQEALLLAADPHPELSLPRLAARYAGAAVLSTALGPEDQVITHLIATLQLPVRIFTLDTGRLFAQSYEVLDSTRNRYGLQIDTYYPRHEALEAMLTQKGPFSFYESVENRKECCYLRKVEPLQRALAGQRLWITGIRAEQSANRSQMEPVEWDAAHGLLKYHPLYHWTEQQVWDFIHQNKIPYNALHDQGYPSIGCQPCTRPVAPGEDPRAGRWWWETSSKECGLHGTKA